MESIYYVMSWLCHRSCEHCYEDRFHPYYGEDLKRVVAEAQENFPRIIQNCPERMTFLDLADAGDTGTFREKIGRVILAGGEILLDPVREPVLYPAIDLLHQKYRKQGGVKVIIQTTGDVLNSRIAGELLERKVWMISVSGMDAYHEGLEEQQARDALQQKLTAMFESLGMKYFDSAPAGWGSDVTTGPYFHFFGPTPDSWIGTLWPRGRAQSNQLSTAGIMDNFCNRWSGGLDFLQDRYSGSEVSVEPNGNVYPCCIKIKMALGSLLNEKLDDILHRCSGNPVYEAISMGHPQRMGIQSGWSVEKFLEKSKIVLPSGRVYQNLCVGCDRFHEEVLMHNNALVSIAK
ncbi:MAG: hypothetical protein DMG57_39350 [Acidobacteria bacterium]|nr:MAG: hypothetical protein DMG57_39350 [Acidobacteriota bacterium]